MEERKKELVEKEKLLHDQREASARQTEKALRVEHEKIEQRDIREKMQTEHWRRANNMKEWAVSP